MISINLLPDAGQAILYHRDFILWSVCKLNPVYCLNSFGACNERLLILKFNIKILNRETPIMQWTCPFTHCSNINIGNIFRSESEMH